MPKVLVVEDDLIIQLTHRKLLERLGCAVDLAEKGEQALEMLKETRYDIIFMDIGLPRISGVDIIKHIRQSTNDNSKTYIVAITGYSGDEDKRVFLAAGADEIAIKPIEYTHLQTIVQQYQSSQQE